MMNLRSIFDEILNIAKWRLRNVFIDTFYVLKWDLYPKLKKKISSAIDKEQNAENPIPVTILSYKRPLYFEKTIKTFLEKNQRNLEVFRLIILVQGEMNKNTGNLINEYRDQIYKVIYSENNIGCAGGYSLLMKEALKLKPSFIINLQDDFISEEPLVKYLSELMCCLRKNDELGYIRLRSTTDRVNDYNVISRKKIKYKKISNHIRSGNGHFTFNPTITKSSIIKKIIPTTSEKDAQEKYQKLGLENGQLIANCFLHIGEERAINWMK